MSHGLMNKKIYMQGVLFKNSISVPVPVPPSQSQTLNGRNSGTQWAFEFLNLGERETCRANRYILDKRQQTSGTV